MKTSLFSHSLAPLGFLCAAALAAAACSSTGGTDSGSPAGGAPGPDGSGGGAPSSGGADPGSTGGANPGSSGGANPGSSGGASPEAGGSPNGGDTGAGGGAGGTPASAVGCAGADLFCEDFEAIADGNLPTGDGWVARDPSCASQNFGMGVSGENPRLGSTKALKVTNHSYASCRLTKSFPDNDDFWLRAFLYWDESVDFTNKEALAVDLLPASGVNKDDPAVRFGNRSKEPCTATPGPQVTMIGMGGGEVTGCTNAVSTPQGRWFCFEAHVQQSANLLVDTYIDGADLSYESVGKPRVDIVDLGQAPTEKVNHIRLGFFTHDSSGRGDLFVDDVSLSTTRLGCGN